MMTSLGYIELGVPKEISAGSQISRAEFRRMVWAGDENLMISLQMTVEIKGLHLHKAEWVQVRIEEDHRNHFGEH